MNDIIQSIKLTVATLFVCCVLYTGAVYAVGFAAKDKAEGSLIYADNGTVIGSRLIAQKFTQDKYFHSRPSAVDYNASGAGGSNLSPLSPKIKERAEQIIAENGNTPVPADMLTASGSGLDPHISFEAALFQSERVAEARGTEKGEILKLLEEHALSSGGIFAGEKIVNVLELNIALDKTVN